MEKNILCLGQDERIKTIINIMIYSRKAKIGKKSYNLCPLFTKEQVAMGYQGMKEPPRDNEGLLFIFSNEETRSFHMQNVCFDLDLLGFGSDGKLLFVIPMKANSKTLYDTGPCRYVVEIKQGSCPDLIPGKSCLKMI